MVCSLTQGAAPATIASGLALTVSIKLMVIVGCVCCGVGFAFGVWTLRQADPSHGGAPTHSAPVRSVASQAPTTYTALRGCSQPRFLPLPDASHG